MNDAVTASGSDQNRAFVAEMLGSKKRLEDYPDRADPSPTSHVRVAGQPVTMHIAERFRFSGRTLVEVRVFISEAPISRPP